MAGYKNKDKYEKYKSLLLEGKPYAEIALSLGITLAGVKKYMSTKPELKSLHRYRKSHGKSSRVWLSKRKCKTCNEVKDIEDFRSTGKYRAYECKRCHTMRLNPGAFDLEDKRYYVYSHIDSNGKCFYIGKGTNKRAYVSTYRNDNWKSIAKNGYEVKILVNGINHRDAIRLEYDFIRQIGKENLTNLI